LSDKFGNVSDFDIRVGRGVHVRIIHTDKTAAGIHFGKMHFFIIGIIFGIKQLFRVQFMYIFKGLPKSGHAIAIDKFGSIVENAVLNTVKSGDMINNYTAGKRIIVWI
jgi:hypothetical protein